MPNHNDTIVTPEFRMVFPQLFEPKPVKVNGVERGEPIYSLLMIFEPNDVKTLKQKAAEVAHQKWPNRDLSELLMPFIDGDKEAEKSESKDKDGSFFKGKQLLKTKSKFAPGVVGPDKKEILNTSDIYSGCYGYAEVNFATYDGVTPNPDGVTAYLNFVMKSRNGERVAGRTAKDVFSGIEGGESDYDPSSDIPF